MPDGRQTDGWMLRHTISSHGLWPGELINVVFLIETCQRKILATSTIAHIGLMIGSNTRPISAMVQSYSHS